MLRIIVRSSSDANALKACLSRFYENLNVDIVSAKGLRKYKFWDYVYELVNDKSKYSIILCGRNDYIGSYAQELDSKPYVSVVLIPRANVRNSPLGEIAKYIGIGKTKFRTSIGWFKDRNTYVLKVCEDMLLSKDLIDVFTEAFFLINEGVKYLSKLISNKLKSEVILLVRKLGGIHEVYLGPKMVCKLKFEVDGDQPIITELHELIDSNVSLSSVLHSNEVIIKTYEEIVKGFIKEYASDADVAIVPWSGGKDSTAVLKLAIDALGKDVVCPVYVDTGVDFSHNIEYIERTSRLLGINYTYLRAPIREFIVLRSEFPTHGERWCTWLKKYVIREFIMKEFQGRRKKVVVILGDRDGESPSRSRKGFIEYEGDIINIYPIKLWGATHVQVYLLSKGIGLNKLYLSGFYRVGCYVCPSLRSWEFYVLKSSGVLDTITKEPLGMEYLILRGLKKRGYDI